MSELKRYKASEFMWNSDVYYIIEADKYIAHQKYKRCLAMWHFCAIKALYEIDCKGNTDKWRFYSKWMHNGFDLANEPTWAKFIQLIHKEAK